MESLQHVQLFFKTIAISGHVPLGSVPAVVIVFSLQILLCIVYLGPFVQFHINVVSFCCYSYFLVVCYQYGSVILCDGS